MKKLLSPLMTLSLPLFAAGGFDLSVQRGAETTRFTSPSGAQEMCVIARQLPGGDYRSKDLENARELCSYDLYKNGPTKSDNGVAICPKVNSTSAAIEFQEIPVGGSKESLEAAAQCGFRRPSDTLTKFKTSDNDRTCTYSPGAVLSFHVARYLGDVLHVPVMVLRTVDIETMNKVATLALTMKTNGVIKKSYQNYVDAHRDPSSWSSGSSIFTNDLKQHYGFLRGKVKGDFSHPGWTDNVKGEAFESMEATRDVFAADSASRLFGKTLNQGSLQRLQAARDYADLIVLDELTSQADRYSGMNLAAVNHYYFKDPQKGLSSIEKSKVDKGEMPKPEGAMLVRRVAAKDNDCAFVSGNTNARAAYVARLRHIHPRTYSGVLRLAKAWIENPSIKQIVATDLNMAPKYVASFEKNLTTTANTLLGNCKSGVLQLDLDPRVQFLEAKPVQGCEPL